MHQEYTEAQDSFQGEVSYLLNCMPTMTSVADDFLRSPAIFHGKRILVVGDIAMDRTFLCDSAPPGRHAVHAGESILDVRPHGDDFGSIGAAFNACILSKAVGADSVLVTTTGDDPEAERVAHVFHETATRVRQIRLSGIQTVTRLRFFVNDPGTGGFRLLLRVDKDPDSGLSYSRAEAEVPTPDFLDWWEREAEKSDAILFSDTGKGFLSRRILVALDERNRRASDRRASAGKRPIVVIVDPKREWEKYFGLQIDVFKPNSVEASGAVQMPQRDWSVDDHLRRLAGRLVKRYGKVFPTMVITLGEHGAALVSADGAQTSLQHFPALPARGREAGIAMHCGDMFAAGLALALCVRAEVGSAIPFANLVASLQVSKPIGQKVNGSDLTSPLNIKHYRDSSSPPRHLGGLAVNPENSPL
jgi:bifunctional ADP-heptose synthase (sugar kinase/adenylyltransferase)